MKVSATAELPSKDGTMYIYSNAPSHDKIPWQSFSPIPRHKRTGS